MDLKLDGPRRLRVRRAARASRPSSGSSSTSRAERRGTITVSTLSPDDYGQRVESYTDASVVILDGDKRIASTAADVPERPPEGGLGQRQRRRQPRPDLHGERRGRGGRDPPAAGRAGRRLAARHDLRGPRGRRLPRPRRDLRRRHLPPPPVGDPAAAGRRAAPRPRRLLGRRAGRGERRVRRPRARVQLDGAPDRGPDRGAPARAHPPRGGDPAGRRVVRGRPRPRRRDGDRRPDGRRGDRRRRRAGEHARAGQHPPGGRPPGQSRRVPAGAARRRGGGHRRRPARRDPGRRGERARGAARLAGGLPAGVRHRLRRPRRPHRSRTASATCSRT